jgi:hypothetical protein
MGKLIGDFSKSFVDNLAERASQSILAQSSKFTPINDGHLRDMNLKIEENGEISLVNETPYAASQYYEIHNHYIMGGAYRSIGKAAVTLSAFQKTRLKKLMGNAKFDYAYWEKFRILKNLGALTPKAARWFHESAEEYRTVWGEDAQAAFVEEARKLARNNPSGG